MISGMGLFIVIGVEDSTQIKPMKVNLEKLGVFNRNKRIDKKGNLHQLYTTCHNVDELHGMKGQKFEVDYYEYAEQDKCTLESVVRGYLKRHSYESKTDALVDCLPKKWSVYPPMVLINSGTFDSDVWSQFFKESGCKEDLFACVLSSGVFPNGLTHIAVNKPIIEADVMRRPFNILPLYGDFGPEPTEAMFDHPSEEDFSNAFWCSVVQNGIFQTWAPRYTMFSRGNIKEKKRLLEQCSDSQGKCVFDLYAGIGYFTLSYLKLGATVFCWEINPWSIRGLMKSVTENGFKYKLIPQEQSYGPLEFNTSQQEGVQVYIFHESNEYAAARYQALQVRLPIGHVNLGFLPTSEPSWAIASTICSNSSTPSTVHVHENVHVADFQEMSLKVAEYFKGTVRGLNKVKTFAPDIWHVVIDVSLD